MLRQANKVTLFDDVTDQIQKLILDGTMKPGDRLPSERELSLQLGVSRNTLRESLKALTLVGILKVHQGGGTYVNEDLNSQIISSLKYISLQKYQEIVDLVDARRVLEVACAYAAARKATPEHIERMAKYNALMVKHKREYEKCSEYDMMFHITVAEASGNKFLYDLLNALRAPLYDVMQTTMYSIDLAIAAHKDILDAIIARDPELAEKSMREHLDTLKSSLPAMPAAE